MWHYFSYNIRNTFTCYDILATLAEADISSLILIYVLLTGYQVTSDKVIEDSCEWLVNLITKTNRRQYRWQKQQNIGNKRRTTGEAEDEENW